MCAELAKRNSEVEQTTGGPALAAGTEVQSSSARERSGDVNRWLMRRLRDAIGNPPVDFRLWDGWHLPAREPSAMPQGCVHIRDRHILWKLLLDPQFQFAEAYCDGRVEVEGDLIEILCSVWRSLPHASRRYQSLMGLMGSLLSGRKRNGSGLRQARVNIARHYDLGNEFYRLWLDANLVYTCAYFPSRDFSLEQAQQAKLDYVCRKLRLRPGERVVEAGCGWGALAMHMARHYGVRVRAFNISRDQLAEARERARQQGLERQVEFIEDDWRNISGTCDAFVSVGMLEHVGLENYQRLGDVIRGCLLPSGRGLLHFIGVNAPRPFDAWTERNIFPGAQPPALSEVASIFEPHEFTILDVENLRPHYALTLRHWLARFEASVKAVQTMFDERFVRMWRLYLASSVASFETGSLQLFQVLFAPSSQYDVPWTRAYQDPLRDLN